MYFCSILVFSHTQPFSCYFGPEPLTWYWACSSFSGFERQAALIQPQMVDVSKIIFSTTTDIRTLESKRRTKCKLICQRTFCSMGMQSFICPCKFQDNFHIFCSSAGGFYQLMSAAWYTEKTDRWGQWWYKRMFCRMGLGFHKALSKSRLFIDPRTQNVLNGVYAWWHQTSTFHHRT